MPRGHLPVWEFGFRWRPMGGSSGFISARNLLFTERLSQSHDEALEWTRRYWPKQCSPLI